MPAGFRGSREAQTGVRRVGEVAGLSRLTADGQGCGSQCSLPSSAPSLPCLASWEMDLLGCKVVFPGLAPTQGQCAPWTAALGGTS